MKFKNILIEFYGSKVYDLILEFKATYPLSLKKSINKNKKNFRISISRVGARNKSKGNNINKENKVSKTKPIIKEKSEFENYLNSYHNEGKEDDQDSQVGSKSPAADEDNDSNQLIDLKFFGCWLNKNKNKNKD